MKKTYRIAFLFLDEIHHLFHFATVAGELAKKHEVHLLTHPQPHPLLYKLLEQIDGGEKVKVEELATQRFRALTDKLKRRRLPRKGFWMKKNMNYLLSFDAVVFTDYFHRYLLEARNQRTPRLIKFPHGVPGRAYGFKKEQLDFDFQLISGKHQYEQYKKMGLLGNNPALVGYPKIDAVTLQPKKPIFDNSNPTVLYNPHFDPEFSSWQETGLEVLEFFKDHPHYNLIFAPHIHLFQKQKGGIDKKTIPEHIFNAENIHVDLGSEASVDMTYLNNADIYLGDVSSQVFEFIIRPRPCIFLNPRNLEYKDKMEFRFWKAGPVISRANELEAALPKATSEFEKFKPLQEQINADNFYSEAGSTASERAAKAIEEFLEKEVN